MAALSAPRRQATLAVERGATRDVVVSPFLSAEDRTDGRARKREALLHAAVRMFNARGFVATSLDDVAASVGATKPVIYRYLGNKDQVLLECIVRGIEQLQLAADAVREVPGSGLDRLRTFLASYVEVTMSDFGICVIRTEETALSPESAKRFRMLKRRIYDGLRQLIEEGVADGSVDAPNVRETAFALLGATNWISSWYKPDGKLPASEISKRMIDILTNGFKPR